MEVSEGKEQEVGVVKRCFEYWKEVTWKSLSIEGYWGETLGEKLVIFWINFPLMFLLIVGLLSLLAWIFDRLGIVS